MICAGAVYASKTGKLRLDRKIVVREVGFYGLSILLLYTALRDVREVPMNNEEIGLEFEDRIFISFGGAFLIFSGYIAYVLVCANMKAVVSLFENLPLPSRSHAAYKSPHRADSDFLSDTEEELSGTTDEEGESEEGDQFEMIATKCNYLDGEYGLVCMIWVSLGLLIQLDCGSRVHQKRFRRLPTPIRRTIGITRA